MHLIVIKSQEEFRCIHCEPNPNIEICRHPKVSCTPHIGAATVEAQERIGEEIVEIIDEFCKQVKDMVS